MMKLCAISFLSFFIISVANGDTLSITGDEPVETVVETVFVNKSAPCAYGRDEILYFANELYKLGDWERASVEYMRYGFFYSDDSCASMAIFRAALCREREKKFAQARLLYTKLAKSSDQRAQSFARYRIPLTYFLQGSADSAIASIDVDTVSDVYGALQYLKGWVFIRQRRYHDALKIFQAIAEQSDESDISGSLSYLRYRCRQGANLPHRSAFLAGMLSAIVPGLGRGYCGRWGDGFFSMLVVGTPAAMAAGLWQSDRTFASIMAGIAAFFYIGNIYGSAKGANIYNEQMQQIFWQTTWNEVPHPPTMLYSELPCSEE